MPCWSILAHPRMPHYSDILAFLRSKHIAVLSTVTKDGLPQSATVFFHVSDVESETRFHIYFVTRQHTRKYSNLLASKKPPVSMVIGTELEPYSVQFDGVAEFIEASEGLDHLEEFGQKLLSDTQLAMLYMGAPFSANPFGKMDGEDFAVFRINPTWVRYMHLDASGTKMEYTQLMP